MKVTIFVVILYIQIDIESSFDFEITWLFIALNNFFLTLLLINLHYCCAGSIKTSFNIGGEGDSSVEDTISDIYEYVQNEALVIGDDILPEPSVMVDNQAYDGPSNGTY